VGASGNAQFPSSITKLSARLPNVQVADLLINISMSLNVSLRGVESGEGGLGFVDLAKNCGGAAVPGRGTQQAATIGLTSPRILERDCGPCEWWLCNVSEKDTLGEHRLEARQRVDDICRMEA